MENEKHEFHISIEKEIFDKLETIKDYHGIKNITNYFGKYILNSSVIMSKGTL
ncbi:hypothetical protein LCGC14_1039070 [marine sediment metagenome]|uniref:Uncharacterized protein n=1 Tax=marine sediment metagenome TaxID=412755 RepID=A0A0F9QAI5_9ZZZZ|nr:MAG: hypothetical protein Lokiarch_32490 [Candidatus Lokiarchaeum sp. GC14_75]